MKATIDIPDHLYRELKAKSAWEGRHVREVAIELFHHWVEKTQTEKGPIVHKKPVTNLSYPAWFGSLRKYAVNAQGYHDMDSIHESTARERAKRRR